MKETYKFTKKDVEEFLTTSARNNKVRECWRDIIQRMPTDLKSEVRQKRTDLTKRMSDSYVFYTRNASEKLQEYLQSFIILVK